VTVWLQDIIDLSNRLTDIEYVGVGSRRIDGQATEGLWCGAGKAEHQHVAREGMERLGKAT
jgi:hypothetical protein